ncbi:hypothetical protein BDZ89DRAFT_1135406 [Hymenopellis radicata]|nr:hypothetical protein BDZ89DRAFT_1135406 [Hymenopellis radicata]
MERLEYGFPLSTLWHYALQATHMVMRTHYGHSPVQDPTCLQAHKDWLNRTWDASKPNYAASKIRKKKRTWNTLRQWEPTLDELKSLVTDIAGYDAADQAKKRKDDWAAHDAFFIRDALLFCDFEDAVAHADAGCVLRVMKF